MPLQDRAWVAQEHSRCPASPPPTARWATLGGVGDLVHLIGRKRRAGDTEHPWAEAVHLIPSHAPRP